MPWKIRLFREGHHQWASRTFLFAGGQSCTGRGTVSLKLVRGILTRHKQLAQQVLEDTAHAQPLHRLGGHQVNGVPELAVHIHLKFAQLLSLLHRGLHAVGQG